MATVTTRSTRAYTREAAYHALIAFLREQWVPTVQRALDEADGDPYTPRRLMGVWTGGIDRLLAWEPSPNARAAAAEVLCAGQRPWEMVVIEPNQPWTPYVTDERRAVLKARLLVYAQAAFG